MNHGVIFQLQQTYVTSSSFALLHSKKEKKYFP